MEDRSINDECFALLIRKTSRNITRAYNYFLSPSGLKSTQLNILVALQEYPLSNLSQIAKKLDMDRSTLSRNLDLLIRNGLVTETPRIEPRINKYELTDKSMLLLEKANSCWNNAQNSILSFFGEENSKTLKNDIAWLNDILWAIIENRYVVIREPQDDC